MPENGTLTCAISDLTFENSTLTRYTRIWEDITSTNKGSAPSDDSTLTSITLIDDGINSGIFEVDGRNVTIDISSKEILSLGFNGDSIVDTARGAVVTNHGVVSSAYEKFAIFDKNSQTYLTVPIDQNADLTGDFTFVAWVYPTSIESEMSIFSVDNNFSIGITTKNNVWSIWAGNSEDWTIIQSDYPNTSLGIPTGQSSVPVKANAWTHIALVHHGTTYTLYVNGIQAKQLVREGNVVNASSTLNIGRWGHSDNKKYFDGRMDDVHLWNTARYVNSFTPPPRSNPSGPVLMPVVIPATTSSYSTNANNWLMLFSSNSGCSIDLPATGVTGDMIKLTVTNLAIDAANNKKVFLNGHIRATADSDFKWIEDPNNTGQDGSFEIDQSGTIVLVFAESYWNIVEVNLM